MPMNLAVVSVQERSQEDPHACPEWTLLWPWRKLSCIDINMNTNFSEIFWENMFIGQPLLWKIFLLSCQLICINRNWKVFWLQQDVVCAWLFSNDHWIKEFLQHFKESRGVLGKASKSKQAGKHLEGIQSDPCPVGACLLLFLLFLICFKMFHFSLYFLVWEVFWS